MITWSKIIHSLIFSEQEKMRSESLLSHDNVNELKNNIQKLGNDILEYENSLDTNKVGLVLFMVYLLFFFLSSLEHDLQSVGDLCIFMKHQLFRQMKILNLQRAQNWMKRRNSRSWRRWSSKWHCSPQLSLPWNSKGRRR